VLECEESEEPREGERRLPLARRPVAIPGLRERHPGRNHRVMQLIASIGHFMLLAHRTGYVSITRGLSLLTSSVVETTVLAGSKQPTIKGRGLIL
jgi:hypothetical protein